MFFFDYYTDIISTKLMNTFILCLDLKIDWTVLYVDLNKNINRYFNAKVTYYEDDIGL